MSSVEAEGGALLQFESTAFMTKVGQTCFAQHLHKR